MQFHLQGPETVRLFHRKLTTEDSHSFFRLNRSRKVMQYTGEPLTKTLSDAREAILKYDDFDRVGYGRWGCFLKETDTLIGFCGLKYLYDLDEVDLGFRLLPEYWGEGYATEASIACVQFGFATLNLKEIIGLVLPENVASIRVLEKAGMSHQCDTQYDGLLVSRFAIRRPH